MMPSVFMFIAAGCKHKAYPLIFNQTQAWPTLRCFGPLTLCLLLQRGNLTLMLSVNANPLHCDCVKVKTLKERIFPLSLEPELNEQKPIL